MIFSYLRKLVNELVAALRVEVIESPGNDRTTPFDAIPFVAGIVEWCPLRGGDGFANEHVKAFVSHISIRNISKCLACFSGCDYGVYWSQCHLR